MKQVARTKWGVYIREIGTLMSPITKLDKNEKEEDVNQKFYLTAIRLDIMFYVCLCARFQACPKESHLIALNVPLDISLVLKTYVYGIPRSHL